MQLQRPSPSLTDTEKQAIAEFNRLHPESLCLAREYAEKNGLLPAPTPSPTQEQVEADLKAMRPTLIDDRPVAQAPPEVEPVPDAPVGDPALPRRAPLAKPKYADQLPWREE
jgi:hypothetical protein